MRQVSIAGARVSAGFSQAELAEKMGLSRTTVAEWESGKREMRTPYVQLFCAITGFSADDLILPKKITK